MKTLIFCTILVLALGLFAGTVAAQSQDSPTTSQTQQVTTAATVDLNGIGAAIGAGIALVGAGLGLGRAIFGAMEGIGRNPEAANPIKVTMIIGCALIEGATFFALAICIIVAVK